MTCACSLSVPQTSGLRLWRPAVPIPLLFWLSRLPSTVLFAGCLALCGQSMPWQRHLLLSPARV
jgi:hypothetical protein